MVIETATDTNITQDFDSALRLTNYTAVSTANSTDTINKDYTYANDGSLLQAEDDRHSIYSQTYSYDFAGRVVNNRIGELSGTEKYKQTVGYDAFGNITSRSTWNDGATGPSYTAGFTNNRKSSGGYQSSVDSFDVAGNITQNQIYGGGTNKRVWTFDAAGRVSSWMETLPEGGAWLFDQGADTTYDGDGRPAKKLDKHRSYDDPGDGFVAETKYRIYSSVTGAEITELNGTGEKAKTSVYLHGKVIAEQKFEAETEIVSFKFGDPLVGTEDATNADGLITPNDVDLTQHEPLGASIPTTDAEMTGMPNYNKGGNWKNPETGCEQNYAPINCRFRRNKLAAEGKIILGGVYVHLPEGAEPLREPADSHEILLTPLGSDDCYNAIYSLVNPKYLDYAKIAVPLLDKFSSTAEGFGNITWEMFAYILATVEGESRFGAPGDRSYSVPMEEDWKPGQPNVYQRSYETNPANEHPGDGYLFRGRGYIQITLRQVYRRLGDAIGLGRVAWSPAVDGDSYTNSLELNPDLAKDPEIAAQIAVLGMRDGLFRGPKAGKLSDFFNDKKSDFEGARKIVNSKGLGGKDIARRANLYLKEMAGHCF